jgi:hypothetical protein
MECVPTLSDEVVNVACPDALSVAVLSTVPAPLNVTVPVGETPVTVAVKVIGWSNWLGFWDDVSVTVVFAVTQVKRSAAVVALVPLGVVTVTSTVPVPGGEIAVIEVALFTVKDLALALPNLIAVVPVKLVPVMVTLVPPAVGPEFGFTLVTVGAGVQVAVKLRSAAGVAIVCFSVVSLLTPVTVYNRVVEDIAVSKSVLFPLLSCQAAAPAVTDMTNVMESPTAKLAIVLVEAPVPTMESLNPPVLTALQPAEASASRPLMLTSAASAAPRTQGARKPQRLAPRRFWAAMNPPLTTPRHASSPAAGRTSTRARPTRTRFLAPCGVRVTADI